jgi:hypothetical protein
VYGSAAQAWNNHISVTDKWYSEAGVGIGKIFDILRFDLTYKLKNPKRLFFTVGISSLF